MVLVVMFTTCRIFRNVVFIWATSTLCVGQSLVIQSTQTQYINSVTSFFVSYYLVKI